MVKDTSQMLLELENCSDFKEFLNENSENIVKKELSLSLNELLKQHNIKKVPLYVTLKSMRYMRIRFLQAAVFPKETSYCAFA